MSVRRFESTSSDPRIRGLEFGERHATQIASTVQRYQKLFAGTSQISAVELARLGQRAYEEILGWDPGAALEIDAMAEAAGLPVHEIAMVNARTEILAFANARTVPECSAIVQLDAGYEYPIAQQNWDWYHCFEDNWLVWRFRGDDGRVVETLTEFGVLAKIGCSSAGVGVLFNILHHDDDGQFIGVPVHVISRRILLEAENVAQALNLIASARRSASTTLTIVSGGPAGKVAVSVEAGPRDLGCVFPDETGLLVHTNHFLSQNLRDGDREHREFPDTVLRYDAIRRFLRTSPDCWAEAMRAALRDTTGGQFAICARPDPRQSLDFQYSTLAHVQLDLEATALLVSAGGPPDEAALTCTHRKGTHHD